MIPNDGLDRRLTAWLDDEAAPYAPSDLRIRFTESVGRTRQRPGWATTERWISMETRAHLGAVPRTFIILVTLALLAALAAGAIVVGGSRESPASNGLIAFDYLGDIYTVEPDGSDRRVLVEAPGMQTGPSWSPDGKRLAYWASGAGGAGWQLMVVDANGSDPVVVAPDVLEVTGWPWAAWSPDGSKLAFTARTLGGPQTACVGSSDADPNFCSSRIFVAAADGTTGSVQVGDPDKSARTAAWSPDGETIAFGSGDAETGIGLYLMDADGTDVRRLDKVSGTGWTFLRLDWSPDGESIVATAGMKSWDIWVFAADGSGETTVSDVPVDPEVTWDQLFPAYAPDGTLAWVGGASGTLTLLEEGGVPVTLAGFTGGPVWSPDGLFIATTTSTAPGDLIIIDREGAIVATIENGSTPSLISQAVAWQRLPG